MPICFRDITFCSSPNCKDKCGVKLTPEIESAARIWWHSFMPGSEMYPDPPISMTEYCDENGEVI